MHRPFAGALSAALFLSFAAAAAETPLSLPDAKFGPEGIGIDRAGDLYLGSLTQGRLIKVEAKTGKVEDFAAAGVNGMVSVVGVHVAANDKTIYACSSDPGISALKGKALPAIVAFDRATGKPAGRFELPQGGHFCNDLTELADGTILATDSFAPRIYALKPGATKLETWFEDTYFAGEGFNLNGIAADGKLVYVVRYNKGTLHAVPVLENGAAGKRIDVSLPRPLLAPDGLTALGQNRFLVVEGGGLKKGARGRLTAVTIKDNKAELHVIADDLKIPTTTAVRDGIAYLVEGQLDHLFDPEAGPADPYRVLRIALPAELR